MDIIGVINTFEGDWENRNMSIPDSTNKTEMDNARSKFKFEGPGSFSVNLKAMKTLNDDINYIEVQYNMHAFIS